MEYVELEEMAGPQRAPRRVSQVRYASQLRQELSARAVTFAAQERLPHECSTGPMPSVLFREDDAGLHGNFPPAAYRRIRGHAEWRRRLDKVHTTARTCLVSHDAGRRELDTSHSSDALLMSIFCHPRAFAASGPSLRSVLGTEAGARLQFGYLPRIALSSGHVERTEVDLRIGSLMMEAKLTEADLQSAAPAMVERYRDAREVFDLDALPCAGGKLLHYQVIRGALAAHGMEDGRFCLLCDARRPDHIDGWYSVIQAVRLYDLRCRLQLLTWQELCGVLPRSLQTWLERKYGILPRSI